MEKQIEIITRQVGTEYRVPAGVDIYAVSRMKSYKFNNQFVFKISVPLLKTMKYKLFKISRIPAIHENHFIWIRTNKQFLLVNMDRTSYQFMSDPSECIPYGDDESLI